MPCHSPWCRGVASLAFEAEAGAAGMLYSVGADSRVFALDASSGEQVLKFKAGSHPLTCIGAAPGQLPPILLRNLGILHHRLGSLASILCQHCAMQNLHQYDLSGVCAMSISDVKGGMSDGAFLLQTVNQCWWAAVHSRCGA